jgi:hypothetical protein
MGTDVVSDNEMVTWLRAEIEADKRAASAKVIRLRWTADPEPWEAGATGIVDEQGGPVAAVIGDYAARHILRQQPLGTIARCDAELAILRERDAAATMFGGARDHDGGGVFGALRALDHAVRLLAYGYRHRNGYKPEWRPQA